MVLPQQLGSLTLGAYDVPCNLSDDPTDPPLCGVGTLSGNLAQCLGGLVLGGYGVPFEYSSRILEVAMLGYLMNHPALACTIENRFFAESVPRSNTEWPVCIYSGEVDHQGMLSGSAGFAWADMELDVWSTNWLDCANGAEGLRQALQGFSGAWGAVGIYAVVLANDTKSVERPLDGSGTWYFSRQLDFRIQYQEAIPQN